MLIVISPAKTLDYKNPVNTDKYSYPALVKDSQELIDVCRDLTPSQIASLMKVSDKIAGLNAARFSEWQAEFNLQNSRQAVFAFRGDVYTGLDVDTFSAAELDSLQKHLRILSGLYGLLRPLDLMQPYRLEMGTSLANPRGKNLYEFWGQIITDKLNQTLQESNTDLLVNLASNEYFKSVKVNKLRAKVVTPIFKDFKNGEYKVISFYAKKARGLMTRFIVQNNISELENLNDFDLGGYRYSKELSNSLSPVFLRD